MQGCIVYMPVSRQVICSSLHWLPTQSQLTWTRTQEISNHKHFSRTNETNRPYFGRAKAMETGSVQVIAWVSFPDSKYLFTIPPKNILAIKCFPFLSAMRMENLKPLWRITKHIQGKKKSILSKWLRSSIFFSRHTLISIIILFSWGVGWLCSVLWVSTLSDTASLSGLLETSLKTHHYFYRTWVKSLPCQMTHDIALSQRKRWEHGIGH